MVVKLDERHLESAISRLLVVICIVLGYAYERKFGPQNLCNTTINLDERPIGQSKIMVASCNLGPSKTTVVGGNLESPSNWTADICVFGYSKFLWYRAVHLDKFEIM